MSKRHWAQRVDDWVRQTPPFIYLVLVALILASAITIWQGISRARDFYEDTFRWRQQEYTKISSLRSGISIAKVEEVLGSPLFVRTSQDGSLVEKTFRGHDYWVQAVHGVDGAVRLFAVTACDEDFRPQFDTPLGRIVLNESTFDGVRGAPTIIRYFVSGATANSYFFDEHWGGNPGLYKTYFLGINDACPAVANYVLNLIAGGVFPPDALNYPDGIAYSDKLPQVDQFRSKSVINTYAEMGPYPFPYPSGDDAVLRAFQIGADRILTRTVDPNQATGGLPEGYMECIRSDEGSAACARQFSR